MARSSQENTITCECLYILLGFENSTSFHSMCRTDQLKFNFIETGAKIRAEWRDLSWIREPAMASLKNCYRTLRNPELEDDYRRNGRDLYGHRCREVLKLSEMICGIDIERFDDEAMHLYDANEELLSCTTSDEENLTNSGNSLDSWEDDWFDCEDSSQSIGVLQDNSISEQQIIPQNIKLTTHNVSADSGIQPDGTLLLAESDSIHFLPIHQEEVPISIHESSDFGSMKIDYASEGHPEWEDPADVEFRRD